MASRAHPTTGPRLPLSRERVLRAAIELADRSGIESLTMRKLAQELGVEAMTLYYHVANKDDILFGIVDIVLGEIELPVSGIAWKADLRRTAISAHEILLRHPWAASVSLSSTDAGPARLRYMDSILASLRRGGFSANMTHHAYHALESHIMGFTMWEVGISAGLAGRQLRQAGADLLGELQGQEYPHLVEHIEQHLGTPDPDDEGEFEFGLGLLLDGLERIRDTPPAGEATAGAR